MLHTVFLSANARFLPHFKHLAAKHGIQNNAISAIINIFFEKYVPIFLCSPYEFANMTRMTIIAIITQMAVAQPLPPGASSGISVIFHAIFTFPF